MAAVKLARNDAFQCPGEPNPNLTDRDFIRLPLCGWRALPAQLTKHAVQLNQRRQPVDDPTEGRLSTAGSTGGCNTRWMQHTESCHGSRSVADALPEADLLLGDTEVVDVGSLAARRAAAADCRPVRSAPFRYRRGVGAVRRHSSTPAAALSTGVATGPARGDIAWCGVRKVDSFDCRCAEPGALDHQPRAAA